jgi:U-box domain/Armadillo/beta-catenin-like repeat
MGDPVILPTGHTFERACIEVCAEFFFSPPSVSPPLDLSSTSLPLLIPNGALKTAIANWCDRSCLPRPTPLSLKSAREIVIKLLPPDHPVKVKEGADCKLKRPLAVRTRKDSVVSSNSSLSLISNSNSQFSQSSSSSYNPSFQSTTEESTDPEISKASHELSTNDSTNPSTSGPADSFEEEILLKLTDGESDSIDKDNATVEAMTSLRQATRENRDRRLALCTARLLSSLHQMLLSRDPVVLTNAAAVIVNLSVERENKVPIVRSGAVPPLIDILKYGTIEAREHAAGALFSLAVEEENRAPIGVLGAIPPLIQLFCHRSDGANQVRHDAGKALYYLTLMETNRSKVVRISGAVRKVISIATSEDENRAIRKFSMMLVCNLVGCIEGRAALLDNGAVLAMVDLIKQGFEEEYSIAAIYGMSKIGLRFRGLAKEAGVENVLAGVVDSGEGVRQDMARKVIQTVQLDDTAKSTRVTGGDWYEWTDDILEIDDESAVSLGVGAFPQQRREVWGDSGCISNKF